MHVFNEVSKLICDLLWGITCKSSSDKTFSFPDFPAIKGQRSGTPVQDRPRGFQVEIGRDDRGGLPFFVECASI
jgi:hypothetical protein